jgi:hypothetical protein
MLEQREYWLPGVDRDNFLEYIGQLHGEEMRAAPGSANRFRQLLDRLPGALELTEVLVGKKDLYKDNDTLTTKMIHCLGIVSGTGDTDNEEVMQAVQKSLATHRFLDPVEINSPGAQSVNPFEDM